MCKGCTSTVLTSGVNLLHFNLLHFNLHFGVWVRTSIGFDKVSKCGQAYVIHGGNDPLWSSRLLIRCVLARLHVPSVCQWSLECFGVSDMRQPQKNGTTLVPTELLLLVLWPTAVTTVTIDTYQV